MSPNYSILAHPLKSRLPHLSAWLKGIFSYVLVRTNQLVGSTHGVHVRIDSCQHFTCAGKPKQLLSVTVNTIG